MSNSEKEILQRNSWRILNTNRDKTGQINLKHENSLQLRFEFRIHGKRATGMRPATPSRNRPVTQPKPNQMKMICVPSPSASAYISPTVIISFTSSKKSSFLRWNISAASLQA